MVGRELLSICPNGEDHRDPEPGELETIGIGNRGDGGRIR